MTAAELQELRDIADELETALEGDDDRQYAAERALRRMRALAGDLA